MDHVLVRIKRQRKNPYKKLLSNTTLYSALDLSAISLVPYDPGHNLDEDAWFKIDAFATTDFSLDILNEPVDAKDYNAATKTDFKNISFILGCQQDDIYFQKVTPAAFIKRKMIQFGETAFLEESIDRLIVKSIADAVYLKDTDMLVFRDLSTISSIFKDIDQLYKEATDEEVKAFLSNDFVNVSGDYNFAAVSKPNRKRIALVSETMQGMSEEQRTGLIGYILDYCKVNVKLSKDGQKFELSSDNELKLVLYGIEERFYTTQHSKQKRLANSVQPL